MQRAPERHSPQRRRGPSALLRRVVRPLAAIDDDPLLLCDCDEFSGHTCD